MNTILRHVFPLPFKSLARPRRDSTGHGQTPTVTNDKPVARAWFLPIILRSSQKRDWPFEELGVRPKTLVTIVAGAAGLSCLGAWLGLPLLQGSQGSVNDQASELLERARRLFHQYHAGFEYKALVLDQLRDAQIDVDARDRQALLDSAEEEYREYHAALWTLYPPTDWPSDPGIAPRPVKASYGNLERQLGEGVSARKALLDKNKKLLDSALSAVNQALAVRSGDVSAATYPEALRLKSAILYHLGLRDQIHAHVKRTESEPYLRKLTVLAQRASSRAPLKTIVQSSGIVDRIRELQGQVKDAEAKLAEAGAMLNQLEAKIRELDGAKSAAESKVQSARQALDGVLAAGVNWRDPKGADAFAAEIAPKDRAYREALRELQVVQFGDYTDSEIDESEDFLTGRYVPRESRSQGMRYGLAHYERERAALVSTVEIGRQALDQFRGDIARLEAQRNSHQAEEERVAAELAAIGTTVQEAFEEWNRLESEARTLDDQALIFLDQSATQARQSVSATNQWLNAARERTQAMSPTASPRSAFDKQQKSKWMAAFTAAQEADAQLAKAWVYTARYQSAQEAAKVLAAVLESVALPGADVEQEHATASEAHDAGVEAVNQTLTLLEKAHADVGKHWTFTSQQAGAIYVLTLLGHAGFHDEAVEAYRLAVKGREDKPYAQQIVSRLKQLEARKR